MSAFPTILFGPTPEVFNTYLDRRFILGQALYDIDGRRFRFGSAGAVNLAAGLLNQSRLPIAGHILQTPVAAAVGATTVTTATTTTAIAVDDYRDGMLLITAGNTGEGYAYPIDTHPAVAGSGNFAVPLKRGITVQVAIGTTANSASLYSNPFFKVLVAATAYTAIPVGVNVAAITATQFGWFQTRGLAAVKVDNTTVVVGEAVVASAATAGNVGLPSATIAVTITQPIVGYIQAIGSSTHTGLVDLHLE
jgi:hypothetical protein